MKRIVILTLLFIMLLAPVVQARTLKDVLDNTTTTTIATAPAVVIGAIVKGTFWLMTLPFYWMEQVAK